MILNRDKPSKIHALSVPAHRRTQEVPPYIVPLVQTVEQLWEAPDPDQYEHCFQGFLNALLAPIERMDEELIEKNVRFRSRVERMIEIAPEFFDKALSRSAFETGYLIERERDDET